MGRAIEGFEAEFGSKNFRRAVHIAHVEFDLLNALSEFFEEASKRPRAASISGRQDVERDMVLEMQLEFLRTLVWRYTRRAVESRLAKRMRSK